MFHNSSSRDLWEASGTWTSDPASYPSVAAEAILDSQAELLLFPEGQILEVEVRWAQLPCFSCLMKGGAAELLRCMVKALRLETRKTKPESP